MYAESLSQEDKDKSQELASVSPPASLQLTTNKPTPQQASIYSLFLRHLLIAFIGSLTVNLGLLAFSSKQIDKTRVALGVAGVAVVGASAKAGASKLTKSDAAATAAFITGAIIGVI